MRARIAALVILLALSPAVATPALAKAPVKLKVGDRAPPFTRTDLLGKTFDLKAQRGKIVAIAKALATFMRTIKSEDVTAKVVDLVAELSARAMGDEVGRGLVVLPGAEVGSMARVTLGTANR